MELSVLNQSNEKNWTRYKKEFQEIATKTQDVVNIKGNYCVSIVFVTPEQIHTINREYRHIDRPTDVISFALKDSEDTYVMMDGEDELGDIFINVEAVRTQAHEYQHSLKREVCFLFTHGLLHLLGYDHMKEDEEKEMFSLQDVILNDIVPKKNSK